MLKKLDPILHNELRLAIMSFLIAQEISEFNELKQHTQATSGNLSVQISKLEDIGYIRVVKGYKGKIPLTECRITPKGVQAFENYVDAIKTYFNTKKSDN